MILGVPLVKRTRETFALLLLLISVGLLDCSRHKVSYHPRFPIQALGQVGLYIREHGLISRGARGGRLQPRLAAGYERLVPNGPGRYPRHRRRGYGGGLPAGLPYSALT